MAILEIPVYTVEAAMTAAGVGAHRLELCSDFAEGGTTPSAGMLQFLKSKVNIPIFVMIRPRGGDFIYSNEEIEVMERDIHLLDKLGADGFVFGVLDEEAQVDFQKNARLVTAANGKPCTFHRAFDLTPNLTDSLNEIQKLGFHRILSSGGKPSVSEGWEVLKELIQLASPQLTLMPGGGSKPEHAAELKWLGLLREIHASCKMIRASQSLFKKEGMSFSIPEERYHQVLSVDPALVQQFIQAMQ
ncbi:MAG: copper homeostasis protein CutC [Mongoliitalea sp.]